MKLNIIYDNATNHESLRFGWGFSCLVDQRILFDTGEEPDSIIHNMKQLKVDRGKIEAIVISHDHWDHTGGLWAMLAQRKGLRVYACPGFSAEFKSKVNALQGQLIEAKGFLAIDDQISVTGEIPGEYGRAYMPEQALLAKTRSGLTVITGCSHPGILTMIEKARAIFPTERIHLVLGGFHLMDHEGPAIISIVAAIKEMGVKNVAPTHCTGHQAQMIFKKAFPGHFLSIAAGSTLEV